MFKTEALNLLEDKRGKALEDVSIGKDFLKRTPVVQKSLVYTMLAEAVTKGPLNSKGIRTAKSVCVYFPSYHFFLIMYIKMTV